jgi:hypothetical protein
MWVGRGFGLVTRFTEHLYTHDSWLHFIIAPSLISTLYKFTTAPAKPSQSPVFSPVVPWFQLLTVGFFNGTAYAFSSQTPLSTTDYWLISEPEPYITTDSQSASLSCNKAPIWGLRPDCFYGQTFEALLMLGPLSDVRAGLSFTIVVGPQQRSHLLFYCLRFKASFCRLLRLAGLRWRYLTPPPHGSD